MIALPDDLLSGYRNFMGTRYASERERYRTLAEAGQTPKTMVIACCDSRAAPETIFDAGPGELFVVRNVANLVPSYTQDGERYGTLAALEFAVLGLKVENILVLGHGRCGGIQAALNTNGQPLTEDNFVGRWMELIKPVTDQVPAEASVPPSERQTALERISIRNSVRNLRTLPYVSEREQDGRLKLHGAWFDISAGELWVLDEATGTFSRPAP
jgi:carbonic anhydrase